MFVTDPKKQPRIFKTSVFSKVAGKAHIGDDALCDAIQEILKGQCDDLGGSVFKITPEQEPASFFVPGNIGYTSICSQKNPDNIDKELTAFRALADAYAGMTNLVLTKALRNKDLPEIRDDEGETEVQERRL
jgi:hypothetical protein